LRARTVLVAAACLAVSAVAWAQPAASAQARALADEGRAWMRAGRFADACPRLQASQELDPRPETLEALADCWERVGRTATAWAAWSDLAAAPGAGERGDLARARAAALEPSLVRLAIVIMEPAPGLVVRADGTALPPGAWGAALPVDPGPHTVEVSAPGRTPFRTTLELAAGTTRLSVPPLVPLAAPPTAPAISIPASRPSPAAAPAAKPSAPAIAGLAVAGAGAIALLVGAGLGLDAGSKRDAAYNDGLCVNRPGGVTLCSAEGKARIDGAYASAAASTIFFVTGGVLAAGGLVTHLLTRPSLHATPGPSGSAGLGVEGTF
jgi:serine/threonine-protein kinase